tara:strand:- start:19 stop:606 length:588 start_codon:yes stop_codon:yes gene_type:complete
MKKCSKCNEDKHLDNYGKCSANKDGLRSDCRECRKNESKKVKLNEEQLYHYCIGNFFYNEDKGLLINTTSGKGRIEGSPVDCIDKTGYTKTVIKGFDYRVHRLMFLMKEGRIPNMIDHINRIKTDNRWSNLRECTRAENNQNSVRKVDQCVEELPSGRFRVRIQHKTVGTFDTMKIAIAMRNAYAKEVYGDFSPY